ncbi:hypothetical protein ABFT80_25370 [Mesorhizobium sp. SB112]|uniref:hypothetical protein n=1 Tax=Mesorhizobium sp. SB112 TaxID=3151853 RepID=UPI003264C5C9
MTTAEGINLWLTGRWDEVEHLQRSLPNDMLVIVEPSASLIIEEVLAPKEPPAEDEQGSLF